jgi:sigma-E factor negative regulatory protein RseC
MIAERARIIAIADGRMVLEPVSSACASCGSVKSCGTAKLSKMLPSGQRKLSLPAQPGRRVGEEVELTLPESALLTAAAVAYLPPLLGLILGVVVGGSGAAGPVGAALGLCLGLFAARGLSRSLEGRFDPIPVERHGVPAHIIPIHKE